MGEGDKRPKKKEIEIKRKNETQLSERGNIQRGIVMQLFRS